MSKSKYYHPDTDWFVKHHLTPPTSVSHGLEEDVISKIKTLKVLSWHLEGNRLMAQTEAGPMMQIIPTDYVCEGMDDKGLPILTKIKL